MNTRAIKISSVFLALLFSLFLSAFLVVLPAYAVDVPASSKNADTTKNTATTSANNSDASASTNATKNSDTDANTNKDASDSGGASKDTDQSAPDSGSQSTDKHTSDSSAQNGASSNSESGAESSAKSNSEPSAEPNTLKDVPSTNSQAQPTIADGTYFINSAVGNVLEVANGSKINGSQVSMYEENGTAAQKWNIVWNSAGYYMISNVGSYLYLSYNAQSATSGASAVQNPWRGTDNQKWLIIKSGSGYKLVNAANPDFVLDVEGGICANGQKVQLYASNGSAAQVFYFLDVCGIKPDSSSIESGIYTIATKGNGNFVLDISGGSWDNNANVQIYENNGCMAQKFYIQKLADGFYQISNLGSGKSLDVLGNKYSSGTNVIQYSHNEGLGQKWSLRVNADGSVSIIGAAGGMFLDVQNGNYSNGTNVWVYIENGADAQKWVLTKTNAFADGLYSFVMNSGLAVDVPGGNTASGVRPQTYWENSSAAQKWKFTAKDSGYTVQSLTSGKFLTNDCKGNVTLEDRNNSINQVWNIGFGTSGMLLVSAVHGINYIYSETSDCGATFFVGLTNKAERREFRIKSALILESGNYIVQNGNGKVLDVVNGFFNNNANVQVWSMNGSGGQKWWVEHKGGNNYTFTNLRSLKALDLNNGVAANGTNVHQYDYNNSNAQLWHFELDENCNILIKAINDTNYALDVSGGSADDGANVQIWQTNGTNAQKWKFIQTDGYSITGDGELDNIIRDCWAQIDEGGDRLWNAFCWVSGFSYRTENLWPGGDWTNDYAKDMYYNGSGNCYRYAALLCVLARSIGYSANTVSGYLDYGTIYPHGWVEVYSDGQTYICDPEGNYEHPGRWYWYWSTYGSTPVPYRT